MFWGHSIIIPRQVRREEHDIPESEMCAKVGIPKLTNNYVMLMGGADVIICFLTTPEFRVDKSSNEIEIV